MYFYEIFILFMVFFYCLFIFLELERYGHYRCTERAVQTAFFIFNASHRKQSYWFGTTMLMKISLKWEDEASGQ